jgi:hypothetical protein
LGLANARDWTSRRLLVARLWVHAYVVHHTTVFVWIPSSRLDGGRIPPRQLCATRLGAMHSPSGCLLTPRVSYWTHWKGVDRHVPHAVVVSFGAMAARYRGIPQVALRCSSGRSPSKRLGLANARDWTSRRLSSYLNPRLSARRRRCWDALLWIRALVPPRTPLPVL